MSSITHGMNPDEVEGLGQLLQRTADQLHRVVTELEQVLYRTIWEGPDATAFKQQWWPDHRGRLNTVADQVHGFGQSALNNASEQRTASGVASSSSATVARGGAIAPSPAVPTSVNGFPGWGQPIKDEQAKAIADLYIKENERYKYDYADKNGTGDDWYQCTVWAKARWQQMGYTGRDWSGDGGQVAANVNRLLGRPDSDAPTVGAIVSRAGHVGVVEEVRTLPNGVVEFRQSEMNAGSNPDVGNYTEFQISEWKATVPGKYTFAPFPS